MYRTLLIVILVALTAGFTRTATDDTGENYQNYLLLFISWI